MGDILRLPFRHIRVDILFEYKEDMILSFGSIIVTCRLTCDYCIPLLKVYGSAIGCDLGFELFWSARMVLVSPVEYPLEGSIGMFFGLKLKKKHTGRISGFIVTGTST